MAEQKTSSVKIKSILISQPKPKEDSPYFQLAERNNIKIDFRPFIQVEGIDCKDFRKSRIDILEHSAVIFTSKTSVDHFFRISEEMRLTIPDAMKYFCVNEQIAYYLQKYIVYRKRKIFFGQGKLQDMMDVIVKNKDEKFFIPLSDQHKKDIPETLNAAGIKYTEATLYRTVCSDLSDLSDVNYDILVFFSPSGIRSLLQNFPDFKQKETKIASFGTSTAKAVKEAGLRLDIEAPMPKAPSMSMALDYFIKEHNRKK